MPGNKKVLIIEDDANLLYGLQAKFRVENYQTITDQGFDKTEVLGKITSSRPDYIILDVILPKINGLDLLKEIKGKPEIRQIPVFIFTNLSDSDSRQQAEKYGAEIYLTKSDFNLDEFIVKFKKIISNKAKLK